MAEETSFQSPGPGRRKEDSRIRHFLVALAEDLIDNFPCSEPPRRSIDDTYCARAEKKSRSPSEICICVFVRRCDNTPESVKAPCVCVSRKMAFRSVMQMCHSK